MEPRRWPNTKRILQDPAELRRFRRLLKAGYFDAPLDKPLRQLIYGRWATRKR